MNRTVYSCDSCKCDMQQAWVYELYDRGVPHVKLDLCDCCHDRIKFFMHQLRNEKKP